VGTPGSAALLNRQLRICLVTPEMPPTVNGGIGTYVRILAHGLAGRGHRVTIAGYRIHSQRLITHDWGRSVSIPTTGARQKTNSFYLRFLSKLLAGAVGAGLPGAWRLSDPLWTHPSWAGALAMRDFLAKHSTAFDIVELSNWPGHGAFLPASTAKYVVRLSTPAADTCSQGQRIYTWLESRSCKRADLIIANSAAMNAKGQAYYGYKPDKAVVVYHGLPAGVPGPQPTDQRPVRLVYVGRAEPRKGTDLLLKALAEVLPRHPDLAISLIGVNMDRYLAACPDAAPAWNTLVKSFSSQVCVLGKVTDAEKDRIVAASHWAVIPSRFESFGLVAVEAMRAGTPIIAADVGGLGEVVKRSPGSVLVAPNDVNALARALEGVAAHGVAYALGLRAQTREAYETFFSAERMIDETLHHYQRILSTSPSFQ
jgi:glycosyltransferase involved in cell wall biosynthesis